MSEPDENQDVCNKQQDTKIQDEFQKGQQASETTPLVPMIPDDIDDSDDNFPLITSVFSLASSDEAESPDKKSNSAKESAKDAKSTPHVTSSTIKYSTTSTNDNVKLSQSSSFRVNPKPSSSVVQGNAPYYVGKGKIGKLLLPKTEEGKISSPLQPAGMTFSKMVSIQPITTSAVTTTTDGTKVSTSMLTRSAQKKAEVTSGNNTGSNVSVIATSGSGSPMINLSTTLPFLNMKSASTQIAVPPLNTATPPSNSSLSVTTPLVQMVQRIAPATTVVTPGNNVVKSPVTTLPKAVPLVTTAVKPPQQKPRHVHIAPAPTNPAQFVVVTKTLSSPTTTNPAMATNAVGGNNRRVVSTPSQGKPPLPVSPGQLMYLIENKTADGKTYRFLIPTDNAKIVTNPATNTKTITVVTTKPSPSAITPSVTATTSPPAPLRIVPKPPLTTAATTVSHTPVATTVSQTQTITVSSVSSSIPASKSAPVNTLNTARQVVLNFGSPPPVAGNVTPPGSTSPGSNLMNLASPISEEESINTPPISPAEETEESPSNDESIDSGLSPHEARIQKLKDLLRKQEDAVNRLREKRKKEIDDIRASPATATPKTDTDAASNKRDRDSPFAVPLPPKKARYEQYKRNKMKETAIQTSKDGFLPNTDDTHFVKLVGLEKVVDKLKAKKILELNENKD